MNRTRVPAKFKSVHCTDRANFPNLDNLQVRRFKLCSTAWYKCPMHYLIYPLLGNRPPYAEVCTGLQPRQHEGYLLDGFLGLMKPI
jgi:hypothetical protein